MMIRKAICAVCLAAILTGCASVVPDCEVSESAATTMIREDSAAKEDLLQAADSVPTFLKSGSKQVKSGRRPRFSIWRPVGAMLVLLALLLAVSAILKRRNGGIVRKAGKRRIMLLERHGIDHRRSLALIEVDGRRVLIGISPDRLQPMAVFQDWDAESVVLSDIEGDAV